MTILYNPQNGLAAKRMQPVKKGLGNKPNAMRELEEDEVDKLFGEGYFGSNDTSKNLC